MASPTQATAKTPNTFLPVRDLQIMLLLAAIYGLAYFWLYGQTPLGQSPALDNRQNMELAAAMASAELPDRPFHRAPLYPALLALILKLGVPLDALPLAGRLLNLLGLLTTTGLTAAAAARFWRSRPAAWIAGLAVGLNPVLVFFAGDLFDITLATTAMAATLYAVIRWLEGGGRGWRWVLGIGLLLALGASLRSHLLPLALIWPVAGALVPLRNIPLRSRLARASLGALGPAVAFLALGFANLLIADEFRILPWQGSYNLWAGNKPGASGRIYAQSVRFEDREDATNPALLESIYLYEQETGAKPPHDISAMNHFWVSRTLSRITSNPLDWTGLMLKKAYYFINSYEQYDNRTYGLHERRFPLLFWNPLHWGLLVLAAFGGFFVGWANPNRRLGLFALAFIFTIYAAGVILFYTSNRFRLPEIPLLAILAGGLLALPNTWRKWGWASRAGLVGGLAGVAVLLYSGWFQARDKSTWEEDYVQMALAALRVNRPEQAQYWAERALALNPERMAAQALLMQLDFNRWALADPAGKLEKGRAIELAREAADLANEGHTDAAVFAGVYLWKLGDRAQAAEIWRQHARTNELAATALLWNDLLSREERAKLLATTGEDADTLLDQAARAIQQDQRKAGEAARLRHLFEPAAADAEANQTN